MQLNQWENQPYQGSEKKPNYSILEYVAGYEEPESNAYHLETAHDYLKPIYFQALDAVISAINDRFEQLH